MNLHDHSTLSLNHYRQVAAAYREALDHRRIHECRRLTADMTNARRGMAALYASMSSPLTAKASDVNRVITWSRDTEPLKKHEGGSFNPYADSPAQVDGQHFVWSRCRYSADDNELRILAETAVSDLKAVKITAKSVALINGVMVSARPLFMWLKLQGDQPVTMTAVKQRKQSIAGHQFEETTMLHVETADGRNAANFYCQATERNAIPYSEAIYPYPSLDAAPPAVIAMWEHEGAKTEAQPAFRYFAAGSHAWVSGQALRQMVKGKPKTAVLTVPDCAPLTVEEIRRRLKFIKNNGALVLPTDEHSPAYMVQQQSSGSTINYKIVEFETA